MRAFHGDPKIKAKALKRMAEHAETDRLVKGRYWIGGKGCFVGCLTHKNHNPHEQMEKLLGIPSSVNYLADCIFEGLPNRDSQTFARRGFLEAIPVGADLSMVMAKFMVWLLTDPDDGVIRFTQDLPACTNSIQTVSSLYQRLIDGGLVNQEEWKAAARAAYAAAGTAAHAAADAASWQKMAAKLIELLSQSPRSGLVMAKLTFYEALERLGSGRKIKIEEVASRALYRTVWVAEWHYPGCTEEVMSLWGTKEQAIEGAVFFADAGDGDPPRGMRAALRRGDPWYGKAYGARCITTVSKSKLVDHLS